MSAQTKRPIRAVVIEDSRTCRSDLVRILEADGDIVVVGQTGSSSTAIQLVTDLRPDIVSMDLYLPDGGGRHAIEQIMASVPTPILVLSGAVDNDRSASVVEALVAGALDALPKPLRWTTEPEAQLRRSARLINGVHVVRRPRTRAGVPAERSAQQPRTGQRVIAIAASTGGPSALALLLGALVGPISAPVLVVQHLHVDFTEGLVEWMSRVSALPVEIATHGASARPGRVYVAPGGVHLRLGAGSHLVLDPEPVTIHRPSADELFTSVALQAGAGAIGVLLTGMGDDGARGLLAIRQQGGRTMAQDEASCAVFGMPRAAQRLGAVTEMLAPAELALAISLASRERRS